MIILFLQKLFFSLFTSLHTPFIFTSTVLSYFHHLNADIFQASAHDSSHFTS